MPYAGPDVLKYASHAWVADWPELVTATNQLEIRLRRQDRPVAADLVLKAYGEFRDRLFMLARDMADLGTRELRRSERETRVRPDTAGGGGKRLGDYLFARPLAQGLLPGAIGIADQETLDNNVPWWSTNEAGSTTQIGRKLYGVFYSDSDAAPPDPTLSRQHPLFQPGNASGLAGEGVIQHGIPERRFIRRAVPVISREWMAGFVAAKAMFDAEITRALMTYR